MAKIIDLAYVDEASAGDPELRADLLNLFLEQVSTVPDYLSQLASQQDFDKLGREAHKFKASVLYMGMNEMGAVLKKLEVVAKKIYVRSCATTLSDEAKRLYLSQINGLSPELDEWSDANLNIESVRQMINFCKLQSEKAVREMSDICANG